MRSIDADALLQRTIYNPCHPPYIAESDIADAPTIEPRHGRWIDKGWNGDWQFQTDGRGNSWHEWECSECEFITKGAKWNYCPNCGADMRESEK